MSHTNVTIGDPFSETTFALYIKKLEAELKFWQDRASYLQKELDNIPAAIQEWGYVDFKDSRGNHILKAIDAVTPPITPKPTEG